MCLTNAAINGVARAGLAFRPVDGATGTGASFHQSDLSAAILFCKAQKMQLPSIQTRLLQCL
jgi:hypothetical protein